MDPASAVESVATTSQWWPVALYMLGLALQRGWDVRKWVRDQVRAGEAVTWSHYFEHYGFLAFITLVISISFFWLWKSEAMQLTAFGLELHVPYVPHFAFVMGFFSDGFSIHLVKMFRNLKARALGDAP